MPRNLSSSSETSPQVSKPLLKFWNLSSSFETSPQVSKHVLKFRNLTSSHASFGESCTISSRNLSLNHVTSSSMLTRIIFVLHVTYSSLRVTNQPRILATPPHLMQPLLESNNLAWSTASSTESWNLSSCHVTSLRVTHPPRILATSPHLVQPLFESNRHP